MGKTVVHINHIITASTLHVFLFCFLLFRRISCTEEKGEHCSPTFNLSSRFSGIVSGIMSMSGRLCCGVTIYQPGVAQILLVLSIYEIVHCWHPAITNDVCRAFSLSENAWFWVLIPWLFSHVIFLSCLFSVLERKSTHQTLVVFWCLSQYTAHMTCRFSVHWNPCFFWIADGHWEEVRRNCT
jgi:hypothetical protein